MTCKSCGKSDHTRKSSEKCLYHNPPRRKRKLQELENSEQLEEKISTIKCALNSICKDDQIYQQIQSDVAEMSGLFCEASIYINFVLYKNWNNGIFSKSLYDCLKCFYHLMSKNSIKYEIDADYKKLRLLKFSSYIYDSSRRQNIFVTQANLYETNFHNNLFVHAYKRIRRFLKQFEKDAKIVYQTLDTLFDRKSKFVANENLINLMKIHLNYNGQGFYDLKNKQKYINYIEFFFNLQKYNNLNGLRNFRLVPIYRFGSHHIQYDSKSLFELLRRFKKISCKFAEMSNDEWHKWFDLKKFERFNKTFGFSLKTDGMSVSLSMSKFVQKSIEPSTKKTKIENDQVKNIQNLMNIRRNLQNGKYKQFIGLDPGHRLILGGIAKNPENDRSLIKISSKKYHHLSGFFNRNYKQKKWTKEIDESSKNTIASFYYIDFTNHILEHFAMKQLIYSQRKITRLKFKTFMCREKAASTIAKEIVGKYKHKSLIILGDTETSSDSIIRGYIRTPNKILTKHISQFADVLRINEFRTTKLCSTCHEVANTSKSPHRYQFCQKCNIVWNRDVNAGNNMLQLGLYHHILSKELPTNFKKSTILQ